MRMSELCVESHAANSISQCMALSFILTPCLVATSVASAVRGSLDLKILNTLASCTPTTIPVQHRQIPRNHASAFCQHKKYANAQLYRGQWRLVQHALSLPS